MSFYCDKLPKQNRRIAIVKDASPHWRTNLPKMPHAQHERCMAAKSGGSRPKIALREDRGGSMTLSMQLNALIAAITLSPGWPSVTCRAKCHRRSSAAGLSHQSRHGAF